MWLVSSVLFSFAWMHSDLHTFKDRLLFCRWTDNQTPKSARLSPPPPNSHLWSLSHLSSIFGVIFIHTRTTEWANEGKICCCMGWLLFFLRITFVQCLLRLISLKALHSAPHNMLVKRNSLMLTVSFAADYFIICKLQNKRLFAFHQPGRVW
jgi:hypothetical protein